MKKRAVTKARLAGAALAAGLVTCGGAAAQGAAYPTKPNRFVVANSPGGGVAGGFRAGTDGRAPGPDLKAGPRGRMPRSAIPPANGWLLEETTERLLGRL